MSVRTAASSDLERMLDLAEAKRDLYRHNAHPFHRPATAARTLQRPFFEGLLGRDDFIVLVHEDASTHVDGFLIGRIGPAPPPIGAAGDPFHVDDFAVDRPDLWLSTGDALLREAARLAHAAGARTAVIVAGSQEIDQPKHAFLHGLGLALAAEWWARPLDAAPGDVPNRDGFEVIVGPAPPVYDPGGPVCLATRLDGPEALPHLERYGAAARAVLAIVPLATGREDVRAVLVARGYTLASEWYAAPIETLEAK